ncbi:unnamed protein product [Linum trigynum]|uniref:Reverse transcriptase zinc-binding domain-containing protein n=1 Tax=Linum trigynum TaxID=586398 RepID=A0AAV2EGY4_9ROSI
MMVYSVKKVWETLRCRAQEVSWHRLIWCNSPSRYSLIAWILHKNAIITRDKLQIWGKIKNALCPLCGLDIETRNHLFLQCTFTCHVASILQCTLLAYRDWDAMVCDFVLLAMLCKEQGQTFAYHGLVHLNDRYMERTMCCGSWFSLQESG